MVRINGKLHWEPEKGDLSVMEMWKMLNSAGHRISLDDYRGKREDLTQLYCDLLGTHPVPVPSHIMLTARDESGRII